MELAVGSIVTGKVTTITKFGAFIALPGGKSGLVHISEVAPTFVNDVHDFRRRAGGLREVLALPRRENQSIREAGIAKPERPERPTRRESAPRRAAQPAPVPAEPAEQTFEDKLKQFMSVSDSKQSELNRYMAGKRGGSRRRK